SENESLHFSLNDWVKYCEKYDFSMGSRFHGNVASFLAGSRSLMIVCDTRTREMSEFFSFPFIWENEFDSNKTLNEYYQMADFSNLISDYHNKISRFCVFLK